MEMSLPAVSGSDTGNIVMTLKTELAWDPVAERFTGPNAETANRFRHRAYRGSWTV